MSKFSHQNDWPRLRADLEQGLKTVVESFIAAGASDRVALRALAKEMAPLNRDLDHLDMLESKKRSIP